MKIHELIYSLDTIESVANDLTVILPQVSIMTFSGPLGVGKTSLITALLRRCGVEGEVASPTFNYLSTYSNAQGETFYHFDLYRLKSLQDFLEAGFDEYLYVPNSWTLIEWPEIIRPLLTKRVCDFVLEYHGLDRRKLLYTILP